MNAARHRLSWALLCLVAGLVVLGIGGAVRAPTAYADKSFSIPSLAIAVSINPDASMDVTERVTYRFSGGPFNFGNKPFDADLAKISGFTAADPSGPLEVIGPTRSSSGNWQWHLREPTSDREVPFTLGYHVADAVAVGTDVADLNWRFVGTSHPAIDTMSIEVTYPPGIPAARPDTLDGDASVVRGFGHGPTNGRLAVTDSHIAITVAGVAAGQFVEIRGIAPAGSFTAPSNGRNQLAAILAVEHKIQVDGGAAASKRRPKPTSRPGGAALVAGLLGALGLVGTGALWLVGGREPRSTEVLGEYWREPLDDQPAIAASTMARHVAPAGTVIAATVVDMAQRGYLTISGVVHERLGPDKVIHHFHWAGRPYAPDVRPWESAVLDLVFRGASEVDADELRHWAKHNQAEAQGMLKGITTGVGAEFEARGYEQKPAATLLGALAVICAAIGIGGWVAARHFHSGVGYAATIAAVGLFTVGRRVLGNRTGTGADAAAKAAGLRNYLRDFSQLADAPIGHLILWERYLVFSVALGVSAELVRGLSVKVPEVVNDPAFGAWYVGSMTGLGRFTGLESIGAVAADTVAAATPSSSGSSGGFSGGGSSGGGGGGGFGAS